jgi:choloylglycine hydrolase
MKIRSILAKSTIVCAALTAMALSKVSACTWFDFRNDLGNCFIGRTMEWPTDLHGRITQVPRGQVLGSFTMKYGFVGMSHGTGMAFSDGMNEHGLACSGLWLNESQFSEKKAGAYHVAELLSYVLGCTKTVDEAVAFIKTNTFYTASEFGGFDLGIPMMIHFAITEPSGRSVVVEFIDGKASIHENKVGAMTNDPRFEEQLKNWSKYEGKKFGEETFEAFDFSPTGKFCRMAAINVTQAKVPTDFAAVNRAWSMVNTVDFPQGVVYWKEVSAHPQFTSYSVVCDLKNRVYYFRTYDNYDIRKIDLSKIDFATAKLQSTSLFGTADYKEFKF